MEYIICFVVGMLVYFLLDYSINKKNSESRDINITVNVSPDEVYVGTDAEIEENQDEEEEEDQSEYWKKGI